MLLLHGRPRSQAGAVLVTLLTVAVSVVGCSTPKPVGTPAGAGGSEGNGGSGTGSGGGGSGGVVVVSIPNGGADGSVSQQTSPGTLVITPANPVFNVSVVNGKAQVELADAGSGALTFQATTGNSQAVAATWSIDRGEMGTIAASTGTFTPTTSLGGVANVSASYAGVIATTTVTVNLHLSQNGAPTNSGVADAGVGGVGGVGGDGPGGPVDSQTVNRLTGAGTQPASATELGWLYPYDQTVWPRAIFAPLLQWQTTHTATSVYIHLQEQNFEFQGFYSGQGLVNQPIDQTSWQAALSSNGGDKLSVELTIADANNVYGPISESWIVASGPLRGTVYYNSYHTSLATVVPGALAAAAILAIQPGSSSPQLALQGAGTKCIACHTVSADGSTLFAQDASEPGDDYSNGSSFDLKNGGATIANYQNNAPDGTTNNRKFLWSGLAKDGTYALQSVGETQEAYAGPEGVYRRDTGNSVAATGLGKIEEAVTPAFSPDGSKVAFDYWTGTLAPGGGNGNTLDLMDFACGTAANAAAGAPSCSSFAFSGLRRLYTATDPTNNVVGWPAWLPDSSGIVFHQGTSLATWHNATAELWFIDVPADANTPGQPIALSQLNGMNAQGQSILPSIPGHPEHDVDYMLNYEPTVNPIASGGYNWVVFTSRRAYGNVLTGDPWQDEENSAPAPFTKKLWVAAIDLKPTPGKDPSHPAFYLPGQELNAGNMRGFWVPEPCRADGTACDTGDECCNGFCRPNASGTLVCGGQPPGCSQEYEKCTTDSDCCASASGFTCINGLCTSPGKSSIL